MGRPLMLVENLFSRRIFPDHALAASSTESGLDVRYVGTGRRQRALNRWAPATTNADAYVQVTFDRPRAFDHLFIDRDSNVAGYSVQVRVSSDGFTTYTTAGSATMPSTVYPYARLSDGVPIRTEEGAIGWRLGKHVGTSVRIFVPAMGAGLKPEFVGLHLGLAFRPEYPPVFPFSHGKIRLNYEVERSPQATAAAGVIGKLREGVMSLKLASRSEYALARYHIEGLFYSRKPMWLAADDEEAEKARYVVAPPGVAGFELRQDWSEYQGEIPYEEHEPQFV